MAPPGRKPGAPSGTSKTPPKSDKPSASPAASKTAKAPIKTEKVDYSEGGDLPEPSEQQIEQQVAEDIEKSKEHPPVDLSLVRSDSLGGAAGAACAIMPWVPA